MTRQVNEKILNIHLTGGLRSRTSDRKPLLRKYAGEPFATQVAKYPARSDLPFVLAQPRIARSGKNKSRTGAQQPRTCELRTCGNKCRQNRVAEPGNAMKMAALVHVRCRVHHLEHGPGDQIPIIGECKWEHGLKLEVHNVALGLVKPVSVFLKLERPNARNRIGQFLVDLIKRFAIRRLR